MGSVNTAEFFVTVASATTFWVELGAAPVNHLVPLVLGGLLAAPVGGWAVQRISARVLMSAVGTLIVLLSLFQLARLFKLIWRVDGGSRPAPDSQEIVDPRLTGGRIPEA